jgi:hypothetical protein
MKRLMAVALLSIQPAMAQDIGLIHKQVEKFAPIYGLSGSAKKPNELRIDFAPAASPAQRQAARNYLATLTKEAPEIQPPDLPGFLRECLSSKFFTSEELVQILICSQEQDEQARNVLIESLLISVPMERQLKLLEIAQKHYIPLPAVK